MNRSWIYVLVLAAVPAASCDCGSGTPAEDVLDEEEDPALDEIPEPVDEGEEEDGGVTDVPEDEAHDPAAEDSVEELTAVLRIDGDPGEAELNLSWTSYWCDDGCYWDVYATQPVGDGVITVALPQDPEEHFSTDWFYVPDGTVPELEITWLVPWIEREYEGDVIEVVAVGQEWLLFVRGPVPADLAALGLHEGWNAARPDWNALNWWPPLELGDLGNVTVAVNLLPNLSVTLSGTVDGSVELPRGLAVLSHRVIDGEIESPPLVDTALTGPWSLILEGRPPVDHFSWQLLDPYYAYEMPVTYVDDNGSGTFDPGEGPAEWACFDGQVVMPIYIRFSRVNVALDYVMSSANPAGWGVDLQGPERLDPSDYDAVVIGGCSLE